MSPSSPPLPIFNFDFMAATSHRPAHSSPLSSSPIQASQSSPPLSPRDPNMLPRRNYNSSPIKPVFGQQERSKWTKYDARDVKRNPLKQNRESALEGKRKLFLKNVRQRQDDKAWERRGGDQEVLKLEWSAQDRRRRQQKEADSDGIVFEDDFGHIPELSEPQQFIPDEDDMMVDTHALDEEAELEAMLSAYEAESSHQRLEPPQRPHSPALSDDEYDSLFMDMLSQQQADQNGNNEDLVLSGQMDLS